MVRDCYVPLSIRVGFTSWKICNVPWGILCLPHEGACGISHAIRAEHNGVGSDSLRVTCCEVTNPREDNNKASCGYSIVSVNEVVSRV